jgi:hypothetical protein
MRTGLQAQADIITALQGVPGFIVTGKPTDTPTVFPFCVVGMPQYDWEPYNTSRPNEATFQVYVIVANDTQIPTNLDTALMSAIDVLWTVLNLAVTKAVPAPYAAGSTQLPCYIVTCEVTL